MSATPIATSTAAPAHFADAMFDAGDAPQLRTILLTDICDSTGLVEVLGDKGAAQLFREHDRLVLGLQQQWRGRLIDRSDGLLLLFERPIDGLGFAIDYARGLAEIGKLRSIDIKIRAGLHVGEVLTWRNSEESVRVGAKPIEVEGLAKPTAARLMSMARPGQILLSAVAEPLAHRAARELGERGQHLIWKSLGRWRFKGVPEPQEIFEVGEPGLAPLRAPANSPKAWRAVPLWRRPAMLAAQLALVVAVGIGGWFVTRPAPAIAFGERDWVVVGDLRNLTGQTVLDESLEQAFRISLEQSRHVNVLSDLKTRDTLARMQLPADTVIDRDIASEIALRDGARAVILPTVAEVGGRVQFSAEVIEPASQTTVHSEQAEGTDASSLLDSVDRVTVALRGSLGEALESIELDHEALPEVATESLPALRAYALAQTAYGQGRFEDATALFRRATELDPEFALAHIGMTRTAMARANAEEGVVHLKRAMQLRERLPEREALYLDGFAAEFSRGYTAPGRWKLLSELYPDYFPAAANFAATLDSENRFDEAESYALKATAAQNPLRSIGFDRVGRARLAQGDYEGASSALSRAVDLGYPGASRRLAAVAAAQFQFEEAKKQLEHPVVGSATRHLERVTIAVDQGDFSQARLALSRALEDPEVDGVLRRALLYSQGVVALVAGQDEDAALMFSQVGRLSLAAIEQSSDADFNDDVYISLAAAYGLFRVGNVKEASRMLAQVESVKSALVHPAAIELANVLRMQLSPKLAAEQSARGLAKTSRSYQARVAILGILLRDGRHEEALTHARWLRNHRGQAYAEPAGGQVMQTLNVADSRVAELWIAQSLLGLGRKEEAQRYASRFLEAWADATPRYLRGRAEEILPASRQ